MISVKLNINKEPCGDCGKENSSYVEHSLFDKAGSWRMEAILLCPRCGSIKHMVLDVRLIVAEANSETKSFTEFQEEEE